MYHTPVGQTLGKYRVLEPLGRGGMARVYRAYHPHLDRYVAIKVLRAELGDDETFLARFRREAQAVAALRHPNIVQVFDFDVQEDCYYMVMELLEGDTLKARLRDYRQRNARFPYGDAVRLLLEHLFVELGIHRVNVVVSEMQEQVIEDLEGLGFHHDGTLRDNEILDGRYVDHHLLSLLEDEYQQWQEGE